MGADDELCGADLGHRTVDGVIPYGHSSHSCSPSCGGSTSGGTGPSQEDARCRCEDIQEEEKELLLSTNSTEHGRSLGQCNAHGPKMGSVNSEQRAKSIPMCVAVYHSIRVLTSC